MRASDVDRWPRLAGHLDELLDLDDAAREAQLAALEDSDAALAAELRALLDSEAALNARGFMAAPALPVPPPLAGQTFGAYRLERELGRGGMGQVWLARRTDGRYEGHVAIKLLSGGVAGGTFAARFAREGRILARLDHRHIARLIDAGVGADRTPYLVLEYVDGLPIDRHVEQRELGVRDVLQLLLDAADAVAHAHARLILHRDLKPSNILVTPGGELKLLDFGIAKLIDHDADEPTLTQQATSPATPLYAAPEQLQGLEVTTATDVYALGVLAYVLLGGGHPTAPDGATTPLERLRAAVEREPRRLSDAVRRRGGAAAARRARALAGDVDTIVARALAKRAQDRYANAAELADDLRRTLAHEPIAARPDAWSYRAAKFVRRNRVLVGAAGVAALALGGGAALALLEAREARAQRAQAEGLIEFMLGDLRNRLQPVGRLDVLDAVGEKALGYYAAQDESTLDAESLSRRAKALHLIGEIAEQRGQMAEAGQRFAQAARSTAALLARAPDDAQRIFDHAQSEYWVAFVARQQGRTAEAEPGFRRYLALAQRLVALDGENAKWRLEVGYAEQNLGVLGFETARPQLALQHLERARAVFEREAARDPAIALSVGRAYGWIARVRESLDEYDLAIRAHRARIDAFARSGAGSDSAHLTALSHADVGRLLLYRGDLSGSERDIALAVSQLARLTAHDPSNRDWQAALAFAQVAQAEVWHAQQRSGEALAVLDEAARVAAALWAGDDKAIFDVGLRARWFATRALVAPLAAGHVTDLTAFVQTVDRSEAGGKRYSRSHQRQIAAATLALGDALAGRGRRDEARVRWEAVVARLARVEKGDEPETTLRAHALQRLGRTQEAQVFVDKLSAGSYRHPLVLDLFARMGRAP